MQMANKPDTSVEMLQNALKKWEASYKESSKTECSNKWRLHADFIHTTYQSILTSVVQRNAQKAELDQQRLQAEAHSYQNQLQKVSSTSGGRVLHAWSVVSV